MSRVQCVSGTDQPPAVGFFLAKTCKFGCLITNAHADQTTSSEIVVIGGGFG